MLKDVRETEIFPWVWGHFGLSHVMGLGDASVRFGTALEPWLISEGTGTEEIEEATTSSEIAELIQANIENIAVDFGRISLYEYPIWAGSSRVRQSQGRSQHEEDLTWFEKNYYRLRDQYYNEWIAISGKQVVSHGSDPGLVLKEARQKGHPRAFITLVPGTWEEE